jgi:NarL family two-component system response regulator LiaR
MGNKIRVLIADDHTVLREATAELIDNQPDMKVVGQASDGESTIDLVKRLRPDVVVIDIAMPRMDGLEATIQILHAYPQTRIMVLSAHQDAEHIIPILEAGAISYLPKTVSLNEMLDSIRATYRNESILPPPIASVVTRRLSGKLDLGDKSALSSRELEVLSLVAKGDTNRQIASRLSVSTRTIEAHLTHIFDKLGVNSRTEAAIMAQRRGWIDTPN